MATITQSPEAVATGNYDEPTAPNGLAERNGVNVEEPQNLDTDGNAADKYQEDLQEEHDAAVKKMTDEKDAAAADIKEAKDAANNNGTPSAPADKDTKVSKKPKGGFDATPIPGAPSGYTIKITIHRAQNLPMADLNSLSSDPFVVTQMYTTNITRHKEDPPLRMRTFTVRRDVNPEWDAEWVVANVPATGFKLKCRIYDEDPADHDDRLGNAHILVPSLDENWQGIQEQSFKVKKRMGSKRAYLVQALATGVRIRKHMDGHLVLSIKMLGKTESEDGGRVYTVGPMWWTRHYSPLLGRFLGRKTPGKQGEDGDEEPGKPKTERYNFQANQYQLQGPIPAELYHRYVEFKPFVKGMFMSSGLRGFFLHKALMHQHSQIYHFDRSTEFDYMKDGPSKETSLKFLELVHFDSGGRIFTYILTLDSLFRFTETGKEFGIDMLSKHTMHSEVASYIAFSGEFFIRRLKHAHRDPPEVGGNNESHPPMDIGNGPPDDDPPQDPAYYELIIDNDSGTYRPKADLLPKLKEFMSHNFPGLKIVTLDCNTDAELQQKLKSEQRQKKKEEGDQIIYRQKAHGSSISSSDESKFNHIADSENGERPNRSFLNTMKNDIARQSKREKRHLKYLTKGRETYDKEKEVQKKQRMEALLHKEGESSGKHENRVKTPEKSATDPVLNGTDNKDKEIAVENGDGPVRTATVGGH